MRIWDSSPSKKPVSASVGRCKWCGNPVMWHATVTGTPVPLEPGDIPHDTVPPAERWHLSGGVACRGTDPREYTH